METPVSLVVILLLLPVGFLIFIAVSIRHSKRQRERLFSQGIQYIKPLRVLLTYVQRHRGMTTAIINGDLQAQAEIDTIATEVNKTLQQIESFGSWMNHNTKWMSLVDHWERLSKAYEQADTDNNFRQHNILIANILYLIEDVADDHYLLKKSGTNTDTDWRHLLSIAEYIGQARALGMGVAIKGECTNVLRVQLNHLRHKIACNIEPSWPEKARSDILYLLYCIDTKLVIDKPNIAAMEYFNVATRCIEHVLEQFDQQIDQLQFYRY